jgi:choline-sulfatase
MLRQGRWKYHHYVRFAPELFDLATDSEELQNLSADPRFAAVLERMEAALRSICDPDAIDAAAKADQSALLERVGGKAAALGLGEAVAAGTPAPVT